jgi:hypothetical protein
MIGLFQRFDFAPHRSRKRVIVAPLQPDPLHAYKKTRGLVKREQRHPESALSNFSHNFVVMLSRSIGRKRKRAHQ